MKLYDPWDSLSRNPRGEGGCRKETGSAPHSSLKPRDGQLSIHRVVLLLSRVRASQNTGVHYQKKLVGRKVPVFHHGSSYRLAERLWTNLTSLYLNLFPWPPSGFKSWLGPIIPCEPPWFSGLSVLWGVIIQRE